MFTDALWSCDLSDVMSHFLMEGAKPCSFYLPAFFFFSSFSLSFLSFFFYPSFPSQASTTPNIVWRHPWASAIASRASVSTETSWHFNWWRLVLAHFFTAEDATPHKVQGCHLTDGIHFPAHIKDHHHPHLFHHPCKWPLSTPTPPPSISVAHSIQPSHLLKICNFAQQKTDKSVKLQNTESEEKRERKEEREREGGIHIQWQGWWMTLEGKSREYDSRVIGRVLYRRQSLNRQRSRAKNTESFLSFCSPFTIKLSLYVPSLSL